MTDLSILLPIYNEPVEYLHQALVSLERQTVEPSTFEVCMHDDGSDSRYRESYRSLPLEDYDLSITWTESQSNEGISAARNHAAANASGEIYALLDGDDLLHPDAIALMQEVFRTNDRIELAYSDNVKFTWPAIELYQYRKKHLYHEYLRRWKGTWYDPLFQSSFVLGFLAFRASMFDEIGGYTPSIDIGEDIDFLVRAHGRTDRLNFYHVPRTLYYRRHSNRSLSRRRQDELWQVTKQRMLAGARGFDLPADSIEYGRRLEPYRVSHYVLYDRDGSPVHPPYIGADGVSLAEVFDTRQSLRIEWNEFVRPTLLECLEAATRRGRDIGLDDPRLGEISVGY